MQVSIPVSIGELFDKVSILQNKLRYISEPSKHINIPKEWSLLCKIAKEIDPKYEEDKNYLLLFSINEELWHIEDGKRDCEMKKDFGEKFIELARNVYKKNDERASIKRKINEQYGSSIIEEKSYEKY
jgi:hypothetical protein